MTQVTKAALLARVEALEKALADSLEQQTATSEILRTISRSPTELGPVLDAVAENAARLCEAGDIGVFQLDGDILRAGARYGTGPKQDIGSIVRIRRDLLLGRTLLERRTIHVHDMAAELEAEYPGMRSTVERFGMRTMLCTPLLSGGKAVGVIVAVRYEVRPFSDKHIQLLETFADQSVIAIENVRLFKVLEARNAALTQAHAQVSETLDQQTATAEILRVIGASPTDAHPVFEAIARSGVRVCGALSCAVFVVDGEMLRLAATHGVPAARIERFRSQFPAPLTSPEDATRAVRERSMFHMADIENNPAATPGQIEVARLGGYCTRLMVPMLRGDNALGLIAVTSAAPTPFPERQVELLKTFADQAVIAIENVRLFKELEARNRDLTEALEQQTATAEILRVISTSPTDLQSVLDAVVRSAARFCGADDASLFRLDGDRLRGDAHHGPIHQPVDLRLSLLPGTVGGRTVLERRTIHVSDLQAESEDFPEGSANAREFGFRTTLSVPLVREGTPIGVIQLRRAEMSPFTDKQIALLQTFADQAVIAIENVRLFTELQEKNRALTAAHAQVTESLEQQTATAEILRVISSSPTDVQPVFDTIVRSAVRLCDGLFGTLLQFDGELLHFVAQHKYTPEALEEVHRVYPARPSRALGATRAILERAVVHIPDVEVDPEYQHHAISRAIGFRSGLFVPMLREGAPIGVIMVSRAKPGLFSDNEIELLKTFADQAVIAVENVRLFKELETRNRDLTEALDRQTATAEILRVISRSQTDVQPVFDTIADNAVSLFRPWSVAVYRFDGEFVHVTAVRGGLPGSEEYLRGQGPRRPTRNFMAGRCIIECSVVHIPDFETASDVPVAAREIALRRGFKATLTVPMLKEGQPIGVISVSRSEAGAFSRAEIDLLQTFADQAVIAIENVRLFKELETRNRDLTEALEQQTATSEILRVISSSPTDVQPVFDTIAARAKRLCDARECAVFRFDGELIHLVAQADTSAAWASALQSAFPRPPGRGSITARAIQTRSLVHIPDVLIDPEFELTEAARASSVRSTLSVPMIREGEVIGAITVDRRESKPFLDKQIGLVQIFADQAVIAVENVRLFKELQEKNRALTEAHAQVTEALEQQTATAEILRIISSSPTDVQPVFDTIVRSAVSLCNGLFCSLLQFDGELIYNVAQHNYTPEALEEVHRIYPTRPTRALPSGRAILERAVVHIPDVEVDPDFQNGSLSRAIGWRSGLFVPMLRTGAAIGAIAVTRAARGPFSDNEIELLKTFADQAVIAVENVRLFMELQARTSELTRSVGELTALGEVSQALSSTLDLEAVLNTIVSRASQLAGAAGCSIYEYDEGAEQFELRATHNYDAEFVEALRAVPLRKGEGLMGRAAEMREPIQISDITQPGAYQSSVRATLIRFGYRALLSVPLLREDQIIGSLSFNRKAPGEFPPEVIDVLKTFATQSALAIQNARLFREIADKSRQLEAASRHKSEFLANMSHELRTPLNAIIGFSEVLMQRMFGELNTKQDEYLKDIYDSGRHLLSLINDILDLSKIEAGRMELELTDFDLPTAIDSALTLVRERATRRGIALQKTLDERIGPVQADERKVRQVVLNLLSNAIKFTPEGGRIEVRAMPVDGSVEVSVTDTGVGIAPEDQEAVFEEFRQVGTSAAKQEGTGLGLALCRKFVELHGGTIWVTSAVGAGSTFTFRLPVRPWPAR
jgi:GAF domain-containing protein